MKCNKLIYVLILFVLFKFTSCANEKLDYFPMEEGLTYEYLGVISKPNGPDNKINVKLSYMDWRDLKEEKVIPIKTDIISKTAFGEETKYTFGFYGKDKIGIFHYAIQREKDIEPRLYKGKIYILKFPIKTGTKWKDEGWEGIIESDNEEVTVPAGTYKNCLKVVRVLKDDKDENKVCRSQTNLYAPGVGRIKELSENKEDSIVSIYNLISFKKKKYSK